MADTVTPKYGFTKPEIGASNNTWGTKVNANFDILDTKAVRNSIQWSITTGDDNSSSTAGPFVVTRYANSSLRIDDPLTINRQTGLVTLSAGLTITGVLTNTGAIVASGDITGADHHASRSATDGVYYFGTNNTSYLLYNVNQFIFSGGPLNVGTGTSTFNGITVTNNVTVGNALQAPWHRFSYTSNPGTPAGVGTMWVDGNGNPCYTHPNGTVVFLGVPPGTVAYTAANSPDAGWAFCDGSTVPRASNPQLWIRIGNNFGGDANNIGLPDIRARVIAGKDDGATGRLTNTLGAASLGQAGGLDYHYLTAAQTPAHTHGYSGSGSGTFGTGTSNQSLNHSHSLSNIISYPGGPAGITTAGVAAPAAITNPTTSAADLTGHTHNVTVNWNWGGNTSNGSDFGLGSSWHPNVQPTIVLTAQIKLG